MPHRRRALSPEQARRIRWAQRGILAVGLALLVWNVQRSWLFLTDDALISLRYTERLLQGDGLTWNDGERVEGYSNLLWVLILAVPGLLGLDLVGSAVGLGLLCAGLSLVVLQRALRPSGLWAEAVGVGLLALSGPLGVWAQAGLEGPLFTLLSLCAVGRLLPVVRRRADIHEHLIPAGLYLGLACLTRPDGPVVVAALAAGLWLAQGQNRRALGQAAVLALIPALFVGGQLAFRIGYYDDWLPNTAYAKLDVASADRLESGLLYLWPWLKAGGWLWALALLGLLRPRADDENIGRLIIPALFLWLVWIIRAGGDHFPGWRMLLVLDPLRALLAGLGGAALVREARRNWPRRRWIGPALLLVTAPLLGLWHDRTQEKQTGMRLVRVDPNWTHRLEPVGRLLGAAFHKGQPLIATCAAGGIPYWSRLPALDPLGLTDKHIARRKLRPGQLGMHGHEAGDTRYVLDRAPDLFVLCAPRGGEAPCLPQERDLVEDPRFQADYLVRWMQGDEPARVTSGPAVRVDSPKLGVVRTESALSLPGWLWADDPQRPATLDGAGRLELHRAAGAEVRLSKLPLFGPRWSVQAEVEPEGARVEGEVVVGDDQRGVITLRFLDEATLLRVYLEALPPAGALGSTAGPEADAQAEAALKR